MQNRILDEQQVNASEAPPALTEGQREWAERVHPLMFYLSLSFLALLASLLVLWIDVPRIAESHDPAETPELKEGYVPPTPITTALELTDEEIAFESAAYRLGLICLVGLVILWPIFWIEQLANRLTLISGQSFRFKHPYWLHACIAPPLRLYSHLRSDIDEIWLPLVGWKTVNARLQRELDKASSVPMVCIALLILPVLGLQMLFGREIINYPVLRLVLHFGTGLIWFAFTVELIVNSSVAKKKLIYCKKHWLDLLIILLPLVSFLRTARFLRVTRLAKLGKIQQLSKFVRVYRVRGVAMRALRALMLLEVIHRLLRTKPEARIAKLEEQFAEKSRELEFLREEIDALRIRISKSKDSVDD